MADYYISQGGSRILNATRVDQSGADNTDVIGWVKTNDFIIAININSNGKDTVAAQYKLRWRNKTDSGTFADVGAATEINYNATTDLVNGNPIAVGGRKCDSQGGDTWQAGEEVEGASLSDSIDLADEYETEIHFALDCSGATDAKEYEFELYDSTLGVTRGTCGATIKMDAWLSGWSYRKEITITGQSGAGTNYQVDLDVGDSAGGDFHLEGHCTNFPQDIVVTDNDGETQLDFWIEDITADPLKMWVEVADDLGSNQTIYVYYGKSGATTNSDISNTFIFGDDFDSYSDGDLNGNGGWSGSTNFDIQSTVVKRGAKAVSNTAGTVTTIQQSTSLTSGVISLYIREDAATGGPSIRMRNAGGQEFMIYFSNTAFLYRNAAGGVVALPTPTSYSYGEWYKVEFAFDTVNDKYPFIKIDGVTKGTDVDSQTVGTVTIIRMDHGDSGTDNTYYDEIYIRKYAATEPAFSSAGSEETPGAAAETKEFSIDSILEATNTKEFSIDAILQKTNTKEFTVDSYLVDRLTKEFTTDAYLQATQTKEFSIDTHLQSTETKEFTIDSILVSTGTKEFSIDSILEATNTKEFTIDSHLVSTGTKEFTTDSLLVDRLTKEFTTDSFLINRVTKDFTTDAILSLTSTKDFTVDAVLKATETKEFSVDAILEATETKTLSIDAILQSTTTKDFSINGILEATQTKDFSTDSLLVNRFTKDFSTDSLLVDRLTKEFTTDSILVTRGIKEYTADAILRGTSTKEFGMDAILTSATTKQFSLDACLQSTEIKEFSVDAYIQSTESKQVSIDSILKATGTKGFTLDSVIVSIGTKDFTTDAILEATNTKELTIDSLLSVTNTKDFSIDSILVSGLKNEFTIDAILLTSSENKRRSVVGIFPVPDSLIDRLDRKHAAGLYRGPEYIGFNTLFSIDAILEATQTKEFTTDGYLVNLLDKTFTTDALLSTTETKEYSINALLQATNTKEFSIDALLQVTFTKDFTTDSYLVNRTTKSFTIDTILTGTASKQFSIDAILESPERYSITIITSESQHAISIISDEHQHIITTSSEPQHSIVIIRDEE